MLIDGKKAATICILKILEKYSDKEHRLSQKDIIEKLDNEYGIVLERKAVSSSLDLLTDLGYQVDKDGRLGVCLKNHLFDNSEASYLIDAVFSSKSIDGKKAIELAGKISDTLSVHDRKAYDYIYKTTEIYRNIHNDFFLTLDLIERAIKEKRMIKFKYLDYDKNGKTTYRYNGSDYFAYPYYIINNFGKWYLVAGDKKRKDKIIYRIEYIKYANLTEEFSPDIKEIKGYESFDISQYINNHFYMNGGQIIKAKLLLERESKIRDVIDWFGGNTKIVEENGKIYAYVKGCDKDIEYWLTQYCEDIKAVEPNSLVNSVYTKLKRALDKYSEFDVENNSSKGIDILKDLTEAIQSIDKDEEFTKKAKKDQATELFKNYLSKYIRSYYDINVIDNKIEIVNSTNSNEKYTILFTYKDGYATDNDFMDILQAIEETQKLQLKDPNVFNVTIVKDQTYYLYQLSDTTLFKYFKIKEPEEIKSRIDYNNRWAAPYKVVKIKWECAKDNKNYKYFII